MSGIIVEFLKLAEVFHKNNYGIYLDLGYEIKSDKRKFFQPYIEENKLFPSYINLIKTLKKPFYNYSASLIEEILHVVTQNNPSILKKYAHIIENYSDYIADKLIHLWNKLNINIVVVENGTLPENIIFTKALYKAIAQYGQQHQFKKYVIWRDHDLMWSSESNINKYGRRPYPNVPKILPSEFISFIVLHHADYGEVLKWSPKANISILRNNFNIPSPLKKLDHSERLQIRNYFRSQYNIPNEGHLLARFTRIIPQKRIDRDIYLLHLLHQQCKIENKSLNICLAIAGNQNENIIESLRLKNLITKFQLNNHVIFTGELKPIGFTTNNFEKSISSLIIACDLCSFLTSYHYESFGNPISESILLDRFFITTSYKRYQHVYGDMGYKSLVFSISDQKDHLITEEFASEVYELLNNEKKRNKVIRHNRTIMESKQKNDLPLFEKLNQLLDVKLS